MWVSSNGLRPKKAAKTAKPPTIVPVLLRDFKRRRKLAAARIAGMLPFDEREGRAILFEAGMLYERLIADDA